MRASVTERMIKKKIRIQYSKMDDHEWKKTKRFRASVAAVVSASACGGYRRNTSPPPQPTSVLTGISTSHGARSRPVVAAAAAGNYTYMTIYLLYVCIYIYIYTYITCVGPSVNFGGSRSYSLGNIIYIYILQ